MEIFKGWLSLTLTQSDQLSSRLAKGGHLPGRKGFSDFLIVNIKSIFVVNDSLMLVPTTAFDGIRLIEVF